MSIYFLVAAYAFAVALLGGYLWVTWRRLRRLLR